MPTQPAPTTPKRLNLDRSRRIRSSFSSKPDTARSPEYSSLQNLSRGICRTTSKMVSITNRVQILGLTNLTATTWSRMDPISHHSNVKRARSAFSRRSKELRIWTRKITIENRSNARHVQKHSVQKICEINTKNLMDTTIACTAPTAIHTTRVHTSSSGISKLIRLGLWQFPAHFVTAHMLMQEGSPTISKWVHVVTHLL